MATYRTYKPKPRSNFNYPFTLAYFTIILCLFVFTPILADSISFLPVFFTFLFIIVVGWGINFVNLFNYRKLSGKFDGSIMFAEDEISVRGVIYKLNEIDKIKFHVEDYRGKRSNVVTLDAALSNGVDNFVQLDLSSGASVKVFFQLNSKNHFSADREVLVSYYRLGKISWLRLIDLLKITNYAEIQHFKKKIHS